jgi:hypothetical protein
MVARLWVVVVLLVVASVTAAAHPDDENQVVTFKGTLTRVDVANRALELDTVDPRTKNIRNVLVFVEGKAKLRDGKARIELSALQPGHRIVVIAEVRHTDAGAERLIAFDLRIDRAVR